MVFVLSTLLSYYLCFLLHAFVYSDNQCIAEHFSSSISFLTEWSPNQITYQHMFSLEDVVQNNISEFNFSSQGVYLPEKSE